MKNIQFKQYFATTFRHLTTTNYGYSIPKHLFVYLTVIAPHIEVCPLRHAVDTKHIRRMEVAELDYNCSLGTLKCGDTIRTKCD